MYNLIERYMSNLKKEDVQNFALKNDIHLNEDELTFTYEFVKKNWTTILGNPTVLNFERFKDKYSLENLKKIQKLFQMYYQKYGYLL